MPLPTDGPILLTGYSRPGETSQSRPKQAMIIRMSDQTLDLLESLPELQFDFSDNPGLTIGDTFFPVTSVQESAPHDLYLRTSSAAKRNAPLKLYANVTGKFAVERQLNPRILGVLHGIAADAKNQRPRTSIVDDNPTDLPPQNSQRRKKGTTALFRNPVRPTDQPRRPLPATPAAASPGGASSAPPLPQRSKEALQALRNRMIRCIASDERTSDQIVKLVGGNDSSASTKRDILELLDEIAEPIPLPNNSKAPKNYRLKTKTWLEIRPYETPGLLESERTSMARSAKRALHDLKIPEDDPVWAHYRNPNVNGATSRNQPSNQTGLPKAGQTSDPPLRGITSTKKKASRPKDSGEIMMKDESRSRPSTSSSIRDDDTGKALPPKPAPARRGPGSGIRVNKPTPTEFREYANGLINGKPMVGESSSSTQDPRRPPTNPSNSSQPSDRRSNGVPLQKTEKLRRDDVAASDTERSTRVNDGDRDRTLKDKEKRREDRERERDRRERERERERERDREGERWDAERQRERETAKRRVPEMESSRERDPSRKKPRDRESYQEREEGERSDDGHRPSKRRRPKDEDDYETSSRMGPKKPKTDSPIPRNTKPRDPSLPKKPEFDPAPPPKPMKRESPAPARLPKIKKEYSKEPTPIPKVSAGPAKPSPSASSDRVASSKPKTHRRGSKIYTSSEDEGEIPPTVKRETAPATIPLTTTNHRNDVSTQSRSHSSRLPPADDHATLRALYDTKYLPYLGNFQLLMKHKTKICNLLKKMDKGSSGSVTESDGEGDLLDPDELRKLAMEYHDQHEYLEDIQRIFSKRD